MAAWANRGGVGFDVLDRVQGSLTVDLIMTLRDDLMTCQREDRTDEVMPATKTVSVSYPWKTLLGGSRAFTGRSVGSTERRHMD